MQLAFECITRPTETDWQDLQKIHQDTAATGLTSDVQELQSFLTKGGEILAGRFNDRIAGVILAMPTEDGLLLHQAGVRSITQRRGVMHQLLHFIQLRARERKQTLLIKDSPDWLSEALQRRVHDELLARNHQRQPKRTHTRMTVRSGNCAFEAANW